MLQRAREERRKAFGKVARPSNEHKSVFESARNTLPLVLAEAAAAAVFARAPPPLVFAEGASATVFALAQKN